MGNYRFVDLVDVPGLQALMDAFYKASGIPVGILDNENNILVATGWQDICTKYHRVNPQTEALCKVSDAYIKANLKVGEYIEYKCQNHMWDLATPIVVKGQHVATLFLGQFFYDDESVNMELFRKQARKYGFPEKEYLEALRKVPIFSRQKVKDIMDYYTRFVHSLIDTALTHAELKEYQANLEGIVSERTTELSKTMGALRESEERYRETFHSSKAVKLLIDPDTGKIFDANKAACAFYGYSFKELTAKYIYEINTLTHDEIQKEMEAARNETRGYFNFSHRLASGETKDVEVYSSPITIGGKEVLHSIIHDVSARKRAENHLRLRADLSDISATSSLDELIQAGLDMAERMTSSQIGFFHFVEDDQENLTLQTWSTNTLKNICKAEGKGAHYPISKAGVWVDCFYEKKPIIHNDYTSLPHKKGMPEGHASVIRELVAPVIRGGKVVAIIGVGNKEMDYTQDDVEIVMEIGSSLIDFAQRKRAEEALANSEQLSRAYLDEAGVMYVILNPDQTVRFISKRGCQILGWPREEIVGEKWFDTFLPQPIAPEVKIEFGRIISGERAPVSEYENPVVTRNGKERLIKWTNTVLRDKEGKITATLSAGEDITERKKVEKALLKAKEDAENATKLKDKFVSLVSHDLKGPLTSMLGLLSMAVTEDQSLDAKQKLDVIKAAVSSGERMRSIIEDLLGVSRLRAGVVKLEMAFVNPYVIAGNAISGLREMADKKGIEFRNDIPVISRIYADPALLEEVMRNILSNAIKFCHPGGKVRIFLPQDELSTIAVADDGIGIPPERIEKLFSYEEKISTPGTSGEMGTGLGLPLCNDIIATMGGKIRVESTIGQGSVFYVPLPYVRPVVMVVDDDPVQVMLITTMLHNLQVDFVMAYSGMEALKIVEAKAPHLVIADIMMTGMDGFDLMENIRKKPGFEKTPVILVTSHGSIETRNTAFQKGANDFITKPLMADELIPRVRRFIW